MTDDTTSASAQAELPPLPEPMRTYEGLGKVSNKGYTAEQMRAYARATLAASAPTGQGAGLNEFLTEAKKAGITHLNFQGMDLTDAVVALAHDLDDAAHAITEQQVYEFATRFRVLAGLDGNEAAENERRALATRSAGYERAKELFAIFDGVDPVTGKREGSAGDGQSVPFGYWHVGETEEESDFFLHSESGDVSCENCVKLFTAPPPAAEVSAGDGQAVAEVAEGGIFTAFTELAPGTPLYLAPPPAASVRDAQEPDMFWNDEDPDSCGDSIHEILDREWGDGILRIGDERTIQQAIRLPNIKVRVIADTTDEDSFDYEEIDAERNKGGKA